MAVKYPILEDKEWLLGELRTKSMMRLAREIVAGKHGQIGPTTAQIIAGCIRYRVQQFSPEEKAEIKRERRFHKNRSRRVAAGNII